MERLAVSLCPACTACPEVVIEGDEVRIGEDANTAVLKKAEWNVLVEPGSRRGPARPPSRSVGRRGQSPGALLLRERRDLLQAPHVFGLPSFHRRRHAHVL